MVGAYLKENISPKEFEELECQEVLSAVKELLDKINTIPVELAEEFLTVKKKVQASL